MRLRSGRCLVGLVTVGLVYGCYSSIADTPKISVVPDSGGLEPEPAGQDGGCKPWRPWEGPGVTGFLREGPREGTFFSGVAFYEAQFEVGDEADAGDSNLGKIKSWHRSGHLSQKWENSPPAVQGGVKMWDDPGVTATYIHKGPAREQVVISHHLRWARAGDDWPGVGNVTQDWIINDAGPPLLDGQAPWGSPGVTATYFAPNGSYFEVISGNRLWRRDTTNNDPLNWRWIPIADGGGGGAYYLADSEFWKAAPQKQSRRPWDGKGVTAAWFFGEKFFVISTDMLWTYDRVRWTAYGKLDDLDGWKSAPTGGCL